MEIPRTADALQKVRNEYGSELVDARREAEKKARALLDRSAGEMTVDQFAELCTILRQRGTRGKARFASTFDEGMAHPAPERLAVINDVLRELWGPSDDVALDRVGHLLAQHELLPRAVPRFPTAIMYLRDPARFGYHTSSTMTALAKALRRSERYSEKSREEYENFCYDLALWRQEWGIEPQEHDAVLLELYEGWDAGVS